MSMLSRAAQLLNLSRKEPKPAQLYGKILQTYLSRNARDLSDWRVAVASAESVTIPRRTNLAKVYRQVTVDAHLHSLMQTRKIMTLGKPFSLINKQGEEDKDATALLQAEWFRQFMDYALDSIYYGYSLIEFGDIVDDTYSSITPIPYDYLVPELHIVLSNIGDTVGMDYTASPYANWSIAIGQAKDLGLLMKAAPLVLWKQNVMGAWSEYAELFGMPFRMGQTDVYNEDLRNNMVDMLSKMGNAGWGVFHAEDKISFIETSKTDAFQVYQQFVTLIDQQLSKLVLGQTGTTDEKAFAGSAKVHQDVANQYAQADAMMMEYVVNTRLLPMMQGHGFPLKGLSFRFDNTEKLSLADKFSMLKELLPYKEVPDAWINDTFGIPVQSKGSDGGSIS